jgi:hypothetical protein
LKRTLNILFKTFTWLIIFALSVVFLTYYALQLPEVQTTITQKATDWLSDKLGGKVTVGNVRISWLDEVTFEDINIKDLENRDMIFVREIYVNCKTNFSFDLKEIIKFNNNLDYVLLKNPEVKLVKEKNGSLNIDNWIASIEKIGYDSTKVYVPDQNTPFTIDNAYVKEGFISIRDDKHAPMADNQFDYYNFRFDKINGNLENVLILGDTVAFKTTSLNALDKKSKLQIKDIKTDFLYCKTAMLLDKLSAYINNSYIGNSLHFYYKKPSDFNDFFEKVSMKGNLKNCIFDAQDLGRFSSNMYAYNERYSLSARMDGRFVDISFKEMDLKFGLNSFLKGDVNFKGFPDLYQTNTDLKLSEARLSKEDVKQYSKNEVYQDYITKIQSLNVKGTYKGFYNDFTADAQLISSNLGTLKGLISMKLGDKERLSEYSGDIQMTDFNLGKLFDEEDRLQLINFSGKINGNGLNVSNATVKADGHITSIGYFGYNYQNITLDGKLGQSIFDGFARINDTNIKGTLNGKVDFNRELNSFKIKGDLFEANLKKLNFIDNDIKLRSEFDFDFVGNKLDDWIGRADFTNTKIINTSDSLFIPSIFFNSGISQDLRRFSIISDFFNFYVNGNFTPSELISDVNVLAKEYKLFFAESEEKRDVYYDRKKMDGSKMPYNANYNIYFKKSIPFFAFFASDVFISEGSNLQGKFLSRSTTELSLEGQIDTLIYKKNQFYNTTLDFYSSKTAFAQEVLTSLIVNSENQKIVNGLLTENLNLNAYWGQSNKIDFDLNIFQKNTDSYIAILGDINFLKNGFNVKLNAENSDLKLLDKKWKIAENNLVTVIGDQVEIENLKLSNKTQDVSLNGIVSKDVQDETILSVNDFELLTLKPFINVELKGTANGNLRLKDFYGKTFYTSNLKVRDFEYKQSYIGNITTETIWDNLKNRMNIQILLDRENIPIFNAKGFYDEKNTISPLNLNAVLNEVQLNMFEGIVEGVFSKLEGKANGALKITGFPLDPVFNGNVKINNGALKVDATGGFLYFDDTIVFNEEGFMAPAEGLTIRDAREGGNIAELQGGIYNGGAGNFLVGMHAYMRGRDGFKIMNTKAIDNQSFYGNAYVNGDLHIDGEFDNLNIVANLTSKKGTNITIPLDGGKEIDVQKEGIPFLGKKNTETLIKTAPKTVKNTGVKMAFNLTFTPDAACEIIFDRTNNDVLNVFGDGKININYDTRGEFTMNGPYIVKSGKYNFSFQNLASLRKFNIVEGSRITWSGDPYEAVLDLKANYVANIPIFKITQLAADANIRYPINVMVSLTERLLTPTIKYDINFDYKQIPIASQTPLLGFEQRLRNDEQLLSRNVSSILVFNEIFPENFADALTQQFLIDNVSNLLSNQIGNLANKLNPNLDLGVQFGDFRENILNNMQLNFSYRFLNNRVKLSGKSSFINAIENNINAANAGQLSVGGEIEYLLSNDGEYRFKLYSRSVPTNYFFSSSGGNVVVSGGNLIISRNFNSFNQIKKLKSIPLGVGRKEENEVSMKDQKKQPK